MLKYCLKKWEENKDKLLEALSKDTKLNSCDYAYIVEKVVSIILNSGNGEPWDSSSIEEINHGDYQGTLLYLIPKNTYQPSEYDYLMTFVNYGSCSCCDILQAIQIWSSDEKEPNEEQLNDFMALCKNLVSSIIKPYNYGWREDEEFIHIEEGVIK